MARWRHSRCASLIVLDKVGVMLAKDMVLMVATLCVDCRVVAVATAITTLYQVMTMVMIFAG